MSDFFKRLFKKECQHDPDMYASLVDGKLTEPGGEPREIKIRMCTIKCLKCDKVLKMIAHGIVHDPVKGIYMNPEREKEVHAELSEKDKKKLLKEIAHAELSEKVKKKLLKEIVHG